MNTALTSVTNSISIKPFGGDGGDHFGADFIKSLAIRSDKLVDAIVINGNHHGGNGGHMSETLVFGSDEYISKVIIRSAQKVDSLTFITNKGRTIHGGGHGGDETILDNIRVIAIAGRSGALLDQIQITYVQNYVPSKVVEKNAHFIIGFTPPNTNLKEYSVSNFKFVDSYSKVTNTMLSQQYNASIEAEYYAKVAMSTEIKYKNSKIETIATELTQELNNSESKEIKIDGNQVGITLVTGTIMQGGDGTIWMFPTTTVSYAVITIDESKNVLNHYDLTGELATQMPKLTEHKTEKNGYTFFSPMS